MLFVSVAYIGWRSGFRFFSNESVELEARIGQKHRRNRSRIHTVHLGLPEPETFPVEVRARRVQGIGGQTVG